MAVELPIAIAATLFMLQRTLFWRGVLGHQEIARVKQFEASHVVFVAQPSYWPAEAGEYCAEPASVPRPTTAANAKIEMRDDLIFVVPVVSAAPCSANGTMKNLVQKTCDGDHTNQWPSKVSQSRTKSSGNVISQPVALTRNTMQNSKTCPKCQSTEIIHIPGVARAFGAGNNISAGATIFSSVKVTRYLCASCGFSEEWIELADDIAAIKKKYRSVDNG